MATFGQWLKHPKFTRVAWLCGSEPALARAVQEAYARALPSLRPLPMWQESRPVWDDLLTVPNAPQLVIVRDAERLKDLALLPALLSDVFDGCYTVFTSTEDDFRREDKQLIEPLAALRDSKHGQMVRCCAPSSEEDAADIVASWWPGAGRNVASALLAECGSITAAYWAADRAVRTGMAPDVKAIPALCVTGSREDYAQRLLAGDRRGALNAAQQVHPDAAGGVLALMASRISLLPLLREAASRRESPQETVRRVRADAWVLRQLRPFAADYGPERVARCRELLAIAETAWKSGSRTGVLEAVAALW